MIAHLALAAVAPVAILSATGCGEAGDGSADPVSSVGIGSDGEGDPAKTIMVLSLK